MGQQTCYRHDYKSLSNREFTYITAVEWSSAALNYIKCHFVSDVVLDTTSLQICLIYVHMHYGA